MTSRDLVLTACNHKQTKRIPIDCGSMRSTGMALLAYKELLEYIGCEHTVPKLYDIQQHIVYLDENVQQLLHVDSMDVGQSFMQKGDDWYSYTLQGIECLIPAHIKLQREGANINLVDSFGKPLGVIAPEQQYTSQCHWPLSELEEMPSNISPDVLSDNMWAVPCAPFHLDLNSKKDYNEFITTIKSLSKNTDKALMISIGQSFFETGQFLRMSDNFACDLILSKKECIKFFDMLLEQYLYKLDIILDELKDDVQIIQFGDDLGTQKGLWMSVDMIKEMLAPYYKKLWTRVHDRSNCKVFFHSCGSIIDILPTLIDCGLDIINPVQTSAENMTARRLKKAFGKDLTFWGGGVDTQHLLSYGTEEEVREDVKRRLDIFAKDGGYVFNPIHNIMPNVPPQNIIAAYETAYNF